MPWRSAIGVEVAGQQVGQLFEGGVGTVAVGFEDHLGAVLGPERQHREHAAGRHGLLLTGTDGDLDRLLRRGGDEQCGGTGVQAAGGADGDGTGWHGGSYGSIVTLIPWPLATMSKASSVFSSGRRCVIRSSTGTAPEAINPSASLLWAGLDPLAPTSVNSR